MDVMFMPDQMAAHLQPARRILVVDDDPDIRSTVRLALEDEGYVVFEAADGAEALQLLRDSETPLVVVLDLRMPHLTGTALLQRASTTEPQLTKHTYILVTANDEMLSPLQRSMLQGMGVPIMCKPFDLEALLALLENAAESAY